MQQKPYKILKHASEDVEQTCLFRWFSFIQKQYPDIELAYHPPNGGKRNKSEAARFKAQGVKSGVPDVVLPFARGKYIGLYVELKSNDNKTTDNQKKWLRNLHRVGHAVGVCYGWVEASKFIEDYLKLKAGEEHSDNGKGCDI